LKNEIENKKNFNKNPKENNNNKKRISIEIEILKIKKNITYFFFRGESKEKK